MNGTFVCPVCKKPGTFVDLPDDPPYVLVCQHCGAQITEIVVHTSYSEVVLHDMPVPLPPRPAAPTPRLDMAKVLAELKSEREDIEDAIQRLEELAQSGGRGPGRPPNWIPDMTVPKRRGRRGSRTRGSNDPGSQQPPPAAPAAARIASRLDRVPSDDEEPQLEAAS
jgi:hypothetical protein